MTDYKVKIGDHTYQFSTDDIKNMDIVDAKGTVHLLEGSISHQAKLMSFDFNSKTVLLNVSGKEIEATIKDEYDQLVDELGFTTESSVIIKDINAPMPGLVLDILVSVGDVVEVGSQLIILEAMKMENVLKSQGEGVIKEIKINKEDAVEKGQLLIVLE